MAENDVLNEEKVSVNEEKVSAGKEELSDKKSSDLGKTILGYIDKGVESSKKGLKIAGNRLSEFGDKSMHRIEISRLNSKLEKTYASIGKLVFEKYTSDPESAQISLSDSDFASNLAEAQNISKEIARHEEFLKK